MATHASVLAWRITWTEEPGGLQSMGLQRVRHNWVTNTHTHTHTQGIHKQVLKLISKFSKATGYRINMQKIICILYTNNQHFKKKVKKIISFIIVIECLEINPYICS